MTLSTPATEPAPAPKPKAPASPDKAGTKDEDAMKLTYVSFGKTMYANSKTNTAIFMENVRVLNMPCEDPKIEIDLDTLLVELSKGTLPSGTMYIKSDRLEVLNRPQIVKAPDGTVTQKAQNEMLAKGRVLVQGQDFYGRADKVTFNEAKDQIVFEGGDDSMAMLFRKQTPNSPPQPIKAKRITYYRNTGGYSINGGREISN